MSPRISCNLKTLNVLRLIYCVQFICPHFSLIYKLDGQSNLANFTHLPLCVL